MASYIDKMYTDLLDLECLHCAIRQVIHTTELIGMEEEKRRELMRQAIEMMAEKGIRRNNCEIIEECYRIVTRAIGDENPYRDVKRFYNMGILAICPEVEKHIWQSENPLEAAVRASIAGNLIDLAASNVEVSLDLAMEKVRAVERAGMYQNDCPSLAEALSKAKTLLVLGDNCGEIALDRELIKTIRRLYPQLHVQYGVRGANIVNDVSRDDAAQVGMEEVAEVIDNGDTVLSTILSRTSEAFNRAFYAADVVIAKGMGNFEGLYTCDRGNIWFCMIAKCRVVAGIAKAPVGSILCIRKD